MRLHHQKCKHVRKAPVVHDQHMKKDFCWIFRLSSAVTFPIVNENHLEENDCLCGRSG